MELVNKLNIQKVEVEIFFSIQVEVHGMCNKYQAIIEVNPNENV